MQQGPKGIATVTMVRSDKHNALDQAMVEGLVKAADQLAGDALIRRAVPGRLARRGASGEPDASVWWRGSAGSRAGANEDPQKCRCSVVSVVRSSLWIRH